MSELLHEANILNSLNDADLSKILGLTVDIEMNNYNQEKITGMIYSLLKQKNFLIRKFEQIKILINLVLKNEEAEPNQISSVFINIMEIKSIQISQRKMNVKLK